MLDYQQVEQAFFQLPSPHRWKIVRRFLDEVEVEKGRPIVKTSGVVGGDARVDRTRIPVWSIVNFRRLGATEEEILLDFPTLTKGDLYNAWQYYEANREEIDRAIIENENA